MWTSVAAGYDGAIAPIMRPYAISLLDLLDVTTGAPSTRLLDVAAGTGVVAMEAARRGADVTATDFSPGMVDIMQRRFAAEGLHARIEVMDGQRLDLPDRSFDVATSTFGLIFFSDPPAGLRQMRRVLRAGGRVGIASWAMARMGLQQLIASALNRAVPELPAAPPPAWVSLGTPEGLGEALRDAGFVEVKVPEVTHPWDPPNPADFFRRLPEWTPPLRLLFANLPAETIDRAANAFADVVRDSRGPEGVPQTAIIGHGIRPD